MTKNDVLTVLKANFGNLFNNIKNDDEDESDNTKGFDSTYLNLKDKISRSNKKSYNHDQKLLHKNQD